MSHRSLECPVPLLLRLSLLSVLPTLALLPPSPPPPPEVLTFVCCAC